MIDVKTFVRGMAWHDVGKPFYLGSKQHSRLGYLWLDALGHPAEALVTLVHYGKGRDDHLRRYWTFDSSLTQMPAVFALSNALDRAAAVTYSFMGESPPEPKGDTHHSWQNPFSRLPQNSPVFEDAFNVTLHQMQSGEVRNRFASYLKGWRDSETGDSLSGESQRILFQALRLATDDRRWQPVTPISSPEQRALALKALLDCTGLYPERTYPPMNDTTLKQHAHLSGVLAFVLHRNLEACDSGFLAQTITLKDGTVQLNDQPLSESDDQKRAMAHLDGFLVRISLEGHRDLFANAVRLDDLHGVRALAERTREALITTLAAELRVPKLAQFLVITCTPFDVTYYLPASLGQEGIQQAIATAYDAALDEVTDELIGDLKRDFRGAKERLDWPSQRNDLKRQLHSLAYGLNVLPVAVDERDNFDKFNAAFARELVTAYENSLEASPFPRDELRRVRADLELPGGEDGSVHEVCQVCETHPIYKRFNERMRDEEYLRKAVHTFRGEQEQICVSCIARRILAHGAVQSEPLHKMLHFDGLKTVRAQQADDGPSLPPNLARTATFESHDDHLDMGAAFVRQTRSAAKRAEGQLLDVFPTVHYAADETGNVALLTLEPTRALFRTYECSEFVGLLKDSDQERLGAARDAQSLLKAFNETFLLYYDQVVEKAKKLLDEKKISAEDASKMTDDVVTVRPHLARVLARIEQVNRFYATLQRRLEKHPLRVLPIDAEYPTARLMVPADQIDVVLKILDQAVSEDLFSAFLGQAERAFLSHLVPPLLRGSVVVFKEKYPLYLALEAERVLMQRLEKAPANQYWGKPLSPKERLQPERHWFGLRLGLCDLRGTLAERGPWQGQVLWDDLEEIVELEGTFDRVTVLRKAILEQDWVAFIEQDPGQEMETLSKKGREAILEQDEDLMRLAEALTLIRANVTGIKLADVERLEDPALFRSVLFLKRLTREGAR